MITIIDCGSKKTPEIGRIISELGAETEIVAMDKMPANMAGRSHGIVISGAPIMLSEAEEQKYTNIFSALLGFDRPILGICFGHQIMGMLYGGIVRKDKECRQSITIKLLARDAIFEGLPEDPAFGEDHTESVSLPPGFEHLATSEFCTVEAMKHKERPIYGVQFHPEISGENGKVLFRNFLKKCKVL